MASTWWQNLIAELVNYASWSPIDIFLDLIQKKFIAVNPVTAVVTQLRDFKHGGNLEKPVILHPIEIKKKKEKKPYWYLRIIVGGFDANGHKTTRRPISVRLHRLIWCSVHGSIPDGMEIHHKDRNKSNNSIDNLELLTNPQHIEINKQTGVYENPQNQPQFSENDPVVTRIKELSASGLSVRKIADQVDLPKSTCQRIITGKYRFKQSKPESEPVEPDATKTGHEPTVITDEEFIRLLRSDGGGGEAAAEPEGEAAAEPEGEAADPDFEEYSWEDKYSRELRKKSGQNSYTKEDPDRKSTPYDSDFGFEPKLPEDVVLVTKIKDLHATGLSDQEISDQVGLAPGVCRKVLDGTWVFYVGNSPTKPLKEGKPVTRQNRMTFLDFFAIPLTRFLR